MILICFFDILNSYLFPTKMFRPGFPPNTKCRPQDPTNIKNDTASTEPILVKSRVFVGCLKKEGCTREDVIELFSMYGHLRGVSFFAPQGFAYIQYDNPADANDAVKNLNKFKFQGASLNVKIANPNMQKAMKGQQQQPGQGPKNQQQKGPQKTTGKSFQNKSMPAPQPLNLFNMTKNTPPKPGSKFATQANKTPLGGGKKNKQQMPQRHQPAKKPRYDQAHQQNYNQEYEEQSTSYYDQQNYNYDDQQHQNEYQGYENPYGDVANYAEPEAAHGEYAEGQYEQGEYVEGEYADYYAGQEGYYDEYGQPVEGYEGQEYAYDPNYYYDEYGQPIEYAATQEGYENQEYDATYYDQSGQAYQNDYYNAPQQNRPPELEPPSKPKKAEFIKTKSQQQKEQKPPKQPQATQELEERPIHYNYEIPDFFICGGCHFCTANPQFFIQHRAKPCSIKQVERGENEPEQLRCHMCADPCKNSWDLVCHLGQKHCLYLFNETHLVNTSDA